MLDVYSIETVKEVFDFNTHVEGARIDVEVDITGHSEHTAPVEL